MMTAKIGRKLMMIRSNLMMTRLPTTGLNLSNSCLLQTYYVPDQCPRGNPKINKRGLQEAFSLVREASRDKEVEHRDKDERGGCTGRQMPERSPSALPGGSWNSFREKETTTDRRKPEEMTSPQRSRPLFSKQSLLASSSASQNSLFTDDQVCKGPKCSCPV